MARIKLQNEFTEDPKLKPIFDEIKQTTGGTVPAVFRAFALHPHLLEVVWEKMKRVSNEGNLPHALKESIALAVSKENGCHYCVNFHEITLRKQGFSEEAIEKTTKGESDEEKIDFVLKFCVKASKNPEKVTDEDIETLKNKFKYTDEDILEILTTMEMYTGLNKILVVLDLPLEAGGCCG